MSTPPPSGQDPFDPRHPQRPSGDEPPPGFPSSGYPQPGGYPPDYPPPAGYPPPDYPTPGYSAYPGPEGGLPQDDPLVPPDFAGWVNRVIGVIQRSLVPLAIIQGILAIVGVVFNYLVGGELERLATGAAADPATVDPPSAGLFGALFLGVLVVGALSLAASAASVHIAIEDAAGNARSSWKESIAAGARFATERLPSLLGWSIALGLIAAVGAFIVGGLLSIVPILGILLVILLIPAGIYLFVVLMSSFFGVVLVERGTPARCLALVNPRLLPTAGRIIIFMVAVWILAVPTALISTASGPVVGPIVSAVLSIPIGLVGVGVTVVTYAELRYHDTPGTLTPQLAAQLRR